MTPAEIAVLGRIAAALSDARLARLRAAAGREVRAAGSVAALDAAVRAEAVALAAALADPEGAEVAGRVAERYGVWAERRRAELNLTLAAARAEAARARDAASAAFARAEALERLRREALEVARREARRAATRRRG